MAMVNPVRALREIATRRHALLELFPLLSAGESAVERGNYRPPQACTSYPYFFTLFFAIPMNLKIRSYGSDCALLA